MKKIVKLGKKDVTQLVDRIISESNRNKMNELVGLVGDENPNQNTPSGSKPIRRMVNNNNDWKNKYSRDTKWCKNIDVEKYGPITVFISSDRQTRIAMDRDGYFFDSNDQRIDRAEAERLLGCTLNTISESTKKPSRTIRLTESEMIEFLDKLATKTQNSKRRRGLR